MKSNLNYAFARKIKSSKLKNIKGWKIENHVTQFANRAERNCKLTEKQFKNT